MWQDVAIGEGPFEVKALAKEIEGNTEFVTLVRNWQRFGEMLGVKDVTLLDMERKLIIGEVRLESIPRELMKIWLANKGSEATFNKLYQALIDCGVPEIARSLYWKHERSDFKLYAGAIVIGIVLAIFLYEYNNPSPKERVH